MKKYERISVNPQSIVALQKIYPLNQLNAKQLRVIFKLPLVWIFFYIYFGLTSKICPISRMKQRCIDSSEIPLLRIKRLPCEQTFL